MLRAASPGLPCVCHVSFRFALRVRRNPGACGSRSSWHDELWDENRFFIP